MNPSAEKNANPPPISRRLPLWFALGYLFFAVYGSLVPLEFEVRPMAEAWIAFRDLIGTNLSFSSRTDWLANILLFTPLAFLLIGALGPAHGMVLNALAVLGVFAVCLGSSVAIEFAQVFFPQRTPSLNDIVAQTIGTSLGIATWLLFGSRFSAWFMGWRTARSPLDIWRRFLYVYLAILFGYNLLPLDLTISPIEILHKWREGKVILLPFSFVFATPVEAMYALAVDAVVWIPAAFLWRMAFPAKGFRSWLSMVEAASALEFLQLFVYSRLSDVTDIFTAALGAAIGSWLAGRMRRPITGGGLRPLAYSVREWGWFVLALLWIAVLAAIFLYPFDFQTDREFLAARLEGARRVPFEVYYFGTEYRAATELMHKTGFFFPLGALLALAVMPIQNYMRRRYAFIAALSMIGIAAFGIEVGQLFVPDKNVDVTDWMLEVLGGLIGFSTIWYLHRLSSPAAPKKAAPVAQLSSALDMPIAMDSIGAQMPGRRALVVIAIGFGILVVIAWIVIRSSLIPYNIRELVDERHPFLSVILLAGSVYWVVGFPVLIVQWLTRGELYLLSSLPMVFVHGLIAWTLLRLAVPVESIHDIVGSPILGWPWEWEMLGRFLALFSFWTVAATAGGIIAAWRVLPGIKTALLGWTVGASLLIPTSYYIVVSEASTDNLVELMADNGNIGAFLLIGLAVVIITFSGTKGTLALIPGAARRMNAVAWMLSAGIMAYWSLYFGTEQIIIKYNQVFSALQFLLSSDRSQLAGPGELIARYAVLYSFLIVAIMMVQYPLWRWIISALPRSGRHMSEQMPHP